jgi:predicted nucleotidyltransferase component of viral defense system
MIPKNEILELATEVNLLTHVVEKDYVLGWLLAGIHQHPDLRDKWVFKGGTCLKKCYFETYRFSEDLDFTLRDAAHINEEFLLRTFKQIISWVYDTSGIEIPDDRLLFEVYKNPRGIESCQGRIYYRGPATPAGKHSMPRVKLDLTADETVVEDPVITPVRHEYSDAPEGGIHIQSYSYVELFAEKTRALKERTRPRDLYDVINFYRRPESREIAAQLRSVLTKKCAYKAITFPSLADLETHRNECAAGWKDQLGHQIQVLPPFDSFWGELSGFFAWLEHPEQVPAVTLTPIPSLRTGEVIGTMAGMGAPQLSVLERIRFAAVNRLCVELDYRKESGERQRYVIEPYSLRATAEGHRLLYGVKLPTNETRSFRTDRIISTTVTEQAFTPRFSIDFLPAGPVGLSLSQHSAQSLHIPQRQPRSPSRKLPRAPKRKGGPRYVFRCTTCGKTFTKSSHNSQLNPHKNKQGSPCYGRFGTYVKTKY